ncbi:hypothetical protein EV361DRAFT_901704 [Lentinula raphanica]|uniref:Uncharacterized protein n=1 Tax=Lentinula raphanica TaxID=153919 RepID=A0AA38UCT6_9AGAR|nr:hypothetical protein C8R42DRAFT_777606 [Lentinula raphanica]KAJ3758911.1 hypothetical protein EV360DRAFT_94406 [Lentinula raphanica]KAJ3777648.1 hypothetical protein FB446DRAFT_106893 [Lentinula raphanica]KAJ3820952.1 hypothetical protein F5880DRAFT_1585238 [Lentinula raphanica]KAJ3837091.1 hypothetical protein F5878DRAFT_564580 [Lentinula raphanica]
MLFYISLLAFVALLVLILHRYRSSIAPLIPHRIRSIFPQFNHYVPLSTFADQASAGMSSSNFDIEANIRDEDSRTGLDERGTQEVMEIMRRERVNFDQARLIRQNRILASNGIDPSGMPLDSKAVTHL